MWRRRGGCIRPRLNSATLQAAGTHHTLVQVPEDRRIGFADEGREVIDEPPPILGTWPRVYALALGELAVVIALFYAFTVAFRA